MKIKAEIQFQLDDQAPKIFRKQIDSTVQPDTGGEKRLSEEIFGHLKKEVCSGEHWRDLPDVGNLLESPATGYARNGVLGFADAFNVPALWLEISNTFTDLRYVLSQAKAYKGLEQAGTTPMSDSLCAYAHFEKMYRLNLAVYDLAKIQDLVIRLLQEAFSGELIPVDYEDEDWERRLTLRSAQRGLSDLKQRGELPGAEYDLILAALERPSKSPFQKLVVSYRNRLTHRIRPSVDYAELFTHVQDRAGEIIRDSQGNERGRTYRVSTGSGPPEFLFEDLYIALSDYMSHVAAMLTALKQIPRLA